jgi:hypothetical protein
MLYHISHYLENETLPIAAKKSSHEGKRFGCITTAPDMLQRSCLSSSGVWCKEKVASAAKSD